MTDMDTNSQVEKLENFIKKRVGELVKLKMTKFSICLDGCYPYEIEKPVLDELEKRFEASEWNMIIYFDDASCRYYASFSKKAAL